MNWMKFAGFAVLAVSLAGAQNGAGAGSTPPPATAAPSDLPDSPSSIVVEGQRKAAAQQAKQQAAQRAADQAAATKAAQDAAAAAAKNPPAPTATAPAAKSAASATATPPAEDSEPLSAPSTPPARTAEDNPPVGDVPTFTSLVDEVNLIFTASDKHNHFVKDLTQEDIKILDDGKAPAHINTFSAQTDLPLQVGLMIDASNSVRDRFKFEQEAAIEFLNQIVRPSTDKAFVVGFDVTPEVTQDFTDNTELLGNGVRMLKPGGGTALYDAIYKVCRDNMLKGPATKGAVRRAIILLSDGDDTASHTTREESIDMAQRAEVIIYVISTSITGTKNLGDKVLERIADATGGRAFFPFKLQDVADAFTEIQDELRSQYRVSYKPAGFQPDGRYRTIAIDAPGRKGIKVRARHGYYAPLGSLRRSSGVVH